MRREILGIHTEPEYEGKIINLKRSIVHTIVEPNGRGFSTESFDRAFKRKRRLELFGLSILPLPSKIEPFKKF